MTPPKENIHSESIIIDHIERISRLEASISDINEMRKTLSAISKDLENLRTKIVIYTSIITFIVNTIISYFIKVI